MRYKNCFTSLRGCQPTLEQLAKAWHQVVQGLVGQERCIELTHLIEPETYELQSQFGILLRRQSERVESIDLSSLAEDIGDWHSIKNLTLSAYQQTPYRRALIEIGPGKETTVKFEAVADDHAWVVTRDPAKSYSCSLKQFERPLGVAGVMAVGGGDIRVAVQAQDADRQAAQRGHDAGRVSCPDQ